MAKMDTPSRFDDYAKNIPTMQSDTPLHWQDIIRPPTEAQKPTPQKPHKKNFALTTIFNAIQKHLQPLNKRNLNIVRRQIEFAANKKDLFENRKKPNPLHQHSIAIQEHIIKSQVALGFYCDPAIAKKIKEMKTITGQELIENKINDKGQHIISIWNEGTQSRDIHTEIFACRDTATGAQIAAFYDKSNNRFTINFGGTDFTHKKDIISISQTTVGAIDLRMTKVKPLIDKTIHAIKTLYPDKLPQTPIDIYAHSAGANSVPLANYFLQKEHGIIPRAQIMFDPYGSKNAFEHTAKLISLAEKIDYQESLDMLTHNTMTYKVNGGSIVDHLGWIDNYNHTGPGRAYESIGKVIDLEVKGHRGKEWIKFFNAKEIEILENENKPPIIGMS